MHNDYNYDMNIMNISLNYILFKKLWKFNIFSIYNFKYILYLGVKEIGIGLHNKNVSKSEGFNINLTKASGITLEVQPSGHVILGKKGITLTCITGSNQNISWLHNGISAPPCGITRCTLLKNGSLHLHKV